VNTEQNTAARVETLLQQMTLAEKIGQMNQYSDFWEVTGPNSQAGDAEMKLDHLVQGRVGSMLNVRGVEHIYKLQKLAVEESRLGIPLIFGFDVIHGHKTLGPIPLAEAASWDLVAIEQAARVAATEAAAVGLNWTFAPMVDISRDARWGRVMEGAGEDPYLGAQVGVARVKGFQGEDLAANNTIAACAKHFAAYGFPEAGREYNTVDIGTSTLYNVVFPPFRAVVDAGVRTVMNAFNILNGVPATANSQLQRDLLKGAWGFDGFIVSDWRSVVEIVTHGFAADLQEAAIIAANAGSDMDMESYAYIHHLEAAVVSGAVPIAVVDDAVRRIVRLKFELGLFDDPYRYCDVERERTMIYHPDHLAAALDMARKSIVLLKNQDNLLPLSRKQEKIAVIGALAVDKTSPLGSWRIGSDDESAVSVLEGLLAYSQNIRYAQGGDVFVGTTDFREEITVNETDRSGFAEAIKLAQESAVVVMVLGEHGFQSGEARSRTQLDLPGLQQELLEAVYAVNPNIVLVLMNGRPLAIPWADEHLPAILETWQLGTQSGHAIAEVLFGDYNPSGKLPMTFPRNVGQVPIYYNHFRTGRPAVAEDVFWSHYIDEANTPLYPFGYGLSYTTFAYANLSVEGIAGRSIKVSIEVANQGNRSGEEVVQLYICDQVATVARPVKELKGFEKVELAPGEMKVVVFILTEKELGFFNNEGMFVVEPGAFTIMVGTNSRDVLSADYRLA